ncbi:MAG: sigma-54-dependent Fis family transcriptional regulator [Holophagales bacterium]|nr:MAG: sigma-54-dependent Fis family transcriptional regulator [Holophagales bacterium]
MIAKVLLVDDDAAFRELLVDILRVDGYQLLEAGDGVRALSLASEHHVDLVLTDQRMPGLSGLELAGRLAALPHPPAVVLMTAYGTIPQAVEAMRAGVVDYLTKPLASPAELRRVVRSALGQPERAPSGEEFLTHDARTLEVLALADRAAATDATILVRGESGTGKELLARRVHRRSARARGPFVAVNCAALPESLAESELFGHERGAFTGAVQRQRGRFELASGGTLFLDEVGELAEPVQAKLLRALEQRAIERVGGTGPVGVDIRLLAATHRDLASGAAEGRFRADLFYRLNVVTLELPPLRERPGDLDLLVPALVRSLADRHRLPPREPDAECWSRLRRHSWPGNVRELRNVLERALIAGSGSTIRSVDLPVLDSGGVGAPKGDDPLLLAEREKRAILEALSRTGGNREQASRLLGISVRTLYNRLREFGLR